MQISQTKNQQKQTTGKQTTKQTTQIITTKQAINQDEASKTDPRTNTQSFYAFNTSGLGAISALFLYTRSDWPTTVASTANANANSTIGGGFGKRISILEKQK